MYEMNTYVYHIIILGNSIIESINSMYISEKQEEMKQNNNTIVPNLDEKREE